MKHLIYLSFIAVFVALITLNFVIVNREFNDVIIVFQDPFGNNLEIGQEIFTNYLGRGNIEIAELHYVNNDGAIVVRNFYPKTICASAVLPNGLLCATNFKVTRHMLISKNKIIVQLK
jgi:hypothetical protein